jgi:hypothetical protein
MENRSPMQAKQRVVLTVSEREASWEIEVARDGAWHPTVYAGSSASVDDAYVTAKRYLLAIERGANASLGAEECALATRRRG